MTLKNGSSFSKKKKKEEKKFKRFSLMYGNLFAFESEVKLINICISLTEMTATYILPIV